MKLPKTEKELRNMAEDVVEELEKIAPLTTTEHAAASWAARRVYRLLCPELMGTRND